jgi:hypothetical protein
MYLIYIDESGKPSFNDPENFVLVSLAVHESVWKDADERVRSVKEKYFPKDPDSVEIHATEIIDHVGPYKNMPLEKRLNLIRDALAIIGDIDCTINAVVIRKNKLCPGVEVEYMASDFLFERICMFLNGINSARSTSGHHEEYGLMMLDSSAPKHDNKTREKIRQLLKKGTEYNSSRFLIEDPIFVDSKERNLSQLADLVAYCIRKEYRDGQKEEEIRTYHEFFKMIEPKFRSSPSGKYIGYGLKVYP